MLKTDKRAGLDEALANAIAALRRTNADRRQMTIGSTLHADALQEEIRLSKEIHRLVAGVNVPALGLAAGGEGRRPSARRVLRPDSRM